MISETCNVKEKTGEKTMPEEKNSTPPQRGTRRKKIGDILVDAGLITKDQMMKALQRQSMTGERLGKLLVDLKFLSEENLVGALSKQLGIPSVDMNKISVPDELMALLPLNFLMKHQVVPVEREGSTLKIAMTNPLDRAVISDIEFMFGGAVLPLVATSSSIENFLSARESSIEKELGTYEGIEFIEEQEEAVDVLHLKNAAKAPAIIRLVNQLLIEAIQTGTESIHIQPRQNDVLVLRRVDGQLRNMTTFQIQAYPAVLARLKIMGKMDVSAAFRPQNGSARVKVSERKVDVHISTLPTLNGEKAVLQLMEKKEKIRSMENLGMHPKDLSAFYSILSRLYGVVLVVGPLGNGISTTLYTTLRYLRTEELNIVTIEDPVEYQIPGINQVQANPKEGLDLMGGIRSLLHQDPNIIMVSEIRDSNMAQFVFQSSLRGYMILSSLYANNIVSAITYLTHSDIKSHLISASLSGLVAQRLVRRNCPHCLEKYTPEPRVLAGMSIDVMEISKMNFFRGKGCKKCEGTGYLGQIGIFEVLEIDYAMRELILRQASEREIFKAAREKGMTTMEEYGLYLVVNKITTLEEVLRSIPSDETITRRRDNWERRIISKFDDAIYVL
jgi:type IV pilus assembly protein PilB